MGYEIICADAMEHLKTMADKSVDVVITDPPYGVRKSESWDDRQHFIDTVSEWLKECHRVAKAGVVWFLASGMLPHILAKHTDTFQRLLVWNKPPGSQYAGASHNRLWYSCEFAAIFDCGGLKTKGKASAFGYSTYSARTVPSKLYGHPTTKPVDLMMHLIEHYSDEGDTILDPFCGSGTTGVAAVLTGRNFIGVEMDRGHYTTALKRVANAADMTGDIVSGATMAGDIVSDAPAYGG